MTGDRASSCQAMPLEASKQALTTLWCVASGRLGDRRGWGDYYSDWGGAGATVTLTCGRGMDRHIAKGDAYTHSARRESWKNTAEIIRELPVLQQPYTGQW